MKEDKQALQIKLIQAIGRGMLQDEESEEVIGVILNNKPYYQSASKCEYGNLRTCKTLLAGLPGNDGTIVGVESLELCPLVLVQREGILLLHLLHLGPAVRAHVHRGGLAVAVVASGS